MLALLLLAMVRMESRVCAAAASVIRGPYLQQGTPGSLVLRWRTDIATDSLVGYGNVPGNFSGVASNGAVVTEHIVTVTNLQPDTKYFYEIGASSGWFPAATNDFFVTSPPIGAMKPTRIWVLGDSGTASAEAAAVRDAYTAYTGARHTDLWLMLGDNAYNSGLDTEYQAAVFNMYPTFLQNSVLWPTLGNHDSGSTSPSGVFPYFDIFTLPQNGEAGGVASGTEHYYSFDYANIHLICLDSQSSDRSSNGVMCNWLRSDLAASLQDWVIAYWHHPPYSKGSHDSDTDSHMIEMRENVLPILESFGVDLVLSGHSHSYERSFLIDGHYGLSTTFSPSMEINGGDGRENGSGAYMKPAGTPGHQGAVYTVCGTSGHTSGGSLNHPAMYLSVAVLGSLVIDVSSNRLDVVFLQTNSVPGDYFTINKAPPPTNAPAAPANLIAGAVSSSQINVSWEDNSDNEAGFKLERSTNGLDFVQFALLSAGMTNATDAGLLSSTTYYYQVRAFNVVGNSMYSSMVEATTLAAPADTTPPAAVTNLAVSSVSSNSASLIWVAPGDDGHSGTATSYDLRYSTGPISETNWVSAMPISGAPAPAAAGTSQAFTVNSLAAAVTYYFALKTSDEANNLSPLSNVARATTATTALSPPAPPTGLRATGVASNEIDLSWTDQANNEDGFKVERSTNGLNFVQIGIAGLNVTNTADRAVWPGSTNYYRVRAYNAAGDSAYSNTNSAQALAPASSGSVITFLIASNAVWKYLDDGSNQGSGWTAGNFDDSAWKSGPAQLGYGGGREATVVSYGGNASAKYITTYFRRHFAVNDPSLITALLPSVQRDDGAVVYLNGQEVFRSNMPATGIISNLTVAPLSVSGTDKTSFHDGPLIDPDELLPGDNVVAVEVHQHSGGSSAMDFNFQLIATNQLAPPLARLAVNLSHQVSIQWNAFPGKTYRVQYATRLPTNFWTNLGNDLIATNSAASATDAIGSIRQRFYRVLRID